MRKILFLTFTLLSTQAMADYLVDIRFDMKLNPKNRKVSSFLGMFKSYTAFPTQTTVTEERSGLSYDLDIDYKLKLSLNKSCASSLKQGFKQYKNELDEYILVIKGRMNELTWKPGGKSKLKLKPKGIEKCGFMKATF